MRASGRCEAGGSTSPTPRSWPGSRWIGCCGPRSSLACAGPLQHWRALRDRIHEQVCEHGFDGERGVFVQSYGSKTLDASLLMLPLVGFLPPTIRA